ncbi:S8 family serine peptidase [soil metagenome]
MWRTPFLIVLAICATFCVTVFTTGSAQAQIGLPGAPLSGPLSGLRDGLRDVVPRVTSPLTDLASETVSETLRAPRRLTGLIRRSDGALQADPQGWPVVSAEIVAVDLSPVARRLALAEGFTVVREERLAALDLTSVVLSPPRGLSLRRAVDRLKRLDPEGDYAFNHVYSPAGEMDEAEAPSPRLAAPPPPPPPPRQALPSLRLGLIDTGVEATHPALAGSHIVQRGFAGPARLAGHGTAVASLMVGRAGGFSGAAPGADLLVADVYGGSPSGGSSTALAEALSWMVENDAQVVNISLVGPRNALVEAAVRRVQARGVLIVAAVGNDGPAAAPLFPAAYDGVVGVTAVNARDRVLPEAARGPQVDFAAPGADMAAASALSNGGYATVRGASFASPLVAGLLARQGAASTAVQTLARTARDLGAPGPDPFYGQGLVGADLRIAPATVGARGGL